MTTLMNPTPEQSDFISKVYVMEAKLQTAGFSGPFSVATGNNYSFMAGIVLNLVSGECPIRVLDKLPADAFFMAIDITR